MKVTTFCVKISRLLKQQAVRRANFMDNQPKPIGKFFYGYIIVAAALLIVTLDYGSRLSFGVFFKPMIGELGWSRTLISGAFTLSMLCQGLMGIYAGRLNDRLGPRFVMTICGFLFGLGFLLMSQVNTDWQLYLFYGLIIGIGMGAPFVSLLSTITRWFVKRRGTMTGVVIAGIGIGTFILPPVANWLISIYDWRISYLIIGGLLLVIGVLAAQVLRRDPSKMGLSPYGQNHEEKRIFTSGSDDFSLKGAINTRQFWITTAVFFCLGYCIFSTSVHLVPNITDLGISATTAANVLAVSGALNAVGCIVLGGAVDKIGSRRVCAISFILIIVSLFWLALVKEVWMFYLFAVIYGIGAGGGAPVESTIVAELFGIKAHGAILGLVNFGFLLGSALGPFLTGFLFDVTGNYHMAFFICAAIGAVGVVLTAILRPPKNQGVKIQ
jgi:OFA family oxalate/formate antiporter-like MFS transporter